MWKYNVTAIDKDWSPLELERYLNDFLSTWELVAVDKGLMIFKRPIERREGPGGSWSRGYAIDNSNIDDSDLDYTRP